jgi:hypothetical protein
MAFPDGWNYRVRITINPSVVDADLTEFPITFNKDILPAVLASTSGGALNGGGDIRFSSDEAGTNRLACDIRTFVTNATYASRRVDITVKVPAVSSSNNTHIYMWWGKTGETQPAVDAPFGRYSVYDSNYVGVWALNENPSSTAPQLLDRTSNTYHMTTYGSMASGQSLADGVVDKAISFDGVNDYSLVTNVSNFGPLHTITALVRNTALQSSVINVSSNTNSGFRLVISADELGLAFGGVGAYFSGFYIYSEVWEFVSTRVTGNGGTCHFRHNDSTNSASVGNMAATAINRITFATRGDINAYTRVELDEVRISKSLRSAEWVKFEYEHIVNPYSVFTLSAVEDPNLVLTSFYYFPVGAITEISEPSTTFNIIEHTFYVPDTTYVFTFKDNNVLRHAVYDQEKGWTVYTGTVLFVSQGSAGNGTYTNPYGTIAQINALTLSAGTKVIFARNSTFSDATLQIAQSGASGSNIIFTSYGIGDKPTFTSFENLTTWTSEGNNIYSHNLTIQSDQITDHPTYRRIMITVDDQIKWMGRYPNTGYRTFTSPVGNSSITDTSLPTDILNDLNLSGNDIVGAEVFIKMEVWSVQRAKITSHNNGVLGLSGMTDRYPYQSGYGYFMQNHISFLSNHGDWYYDDSTSKLYMYLNEVPSLYNIKAGKRNHIINIATVTNYITLENLKLKGSNSDGIYRAYWINPISSYWSIYNLEIEHCAGAGMRVHLDHSTISYCDIKNTGGIGLRVTGNTTNLLNNTTYKSGVIPGFLGSSDGITTEGTNFIIRYNKVDRTGASGISFYGSNALFKNNEILRIGFVTDDIGGIYLSDFGSGYVNRTIEENIILHSIGNREGTPYTFSQSVGIFIDDLSSDVLLLNNLAAFCGAYGHLNHTGRDYAIQGNTFFGNFSNQVYLSSKTWGIVEDIVLSNNILIGLDAEKGLIKVDSRTSNPNYFSIINLNTYIQVGNLNKAFHTEAPSPVGTVYYDFNGWKTYLSNQSATSGADLDSTIQLVNISSLHLCFNNTLVNKTVTPSVEMTEPDGTVHAALIPITLEPYDSMVLIGNGPVEGEYIPEEIREVVYIPNGQISNISFDITFTSNKFIVSSYIDSFYFDDNGVHMTAYYDGQEWKFFSIVGGKIYNWYAINPARTGGDSFTSNDIWRVPSDTDFTILTDYCIASDVDLTVTNIGNQFKTRRQVNSPYGTPWETSVHPRWSSDPTNFGTDIYNLSLTPGGNRSANGWFNADSGTGCVLWCSNVPWSQILRYDNGIVLRTWDYSEPHGFGVVLVRNATQTEQLLDDGTVVESYIQNDGLPIKAVKIGTHVWTSKIVETKWRNGTTIPFAGNNGTSFTVAEWAALNTPAVCDWNDNAVNSLMYPTLNEGLWSESNVGIVAQGTMIKSSNVSSLETLDITKQSSVIKSSNLSDSEELQVITQSSIQKVSGSTIPVLYSYPGDGVMTPIKTVADYTNVVHFDYQLGNNSNAGTVGAPFKDYNLKYPNSVPANTAFLFKRGSVHPRIGRRADSTILWNQQHNNSFFGAYGEGAMPIIEGFWIMGYLNGQNTVGAKNVTIRDIDIHAESSWPWGTDIIVNLYYSPENITLAYCKVHGKHRPDRSWPPNFKIEGSVFPYPLYGIGKSVKSGSQLVIFNCEIYDIGLDAMDLWGAYPLRCIRNYIYNLNRRNWGQGYTLADDTQDGGIGDGIRLANNCSLAYIAGNYIDFARDYYLEQPSNQLDWHKHCVLLYGSAINDGWISALGPLSLIHNTFIIAPPGTVKSGNVYVNCPPGSDMKWNLFDNTRKGQYQWSVCMTAWNYRLNDHFQQTNPVRVAENHFIKGGESKYFYLNADNFIHNSNQLFETWAAYQAYTGTEVGSDINPDNMTNFFDGPSHDDPTPPVPPQEPFVIESVFTANPNANVQNITINPGVEIQANRLLVVFISGRYRGYSISVSHPTGWTVGNFINTGTDHGDTWGYYAYKILTQAETTSYTFSYNYCNSVATMLAITGYDSANPMGVLSSAVGTSGNIVAPSITPNNNTMLLYMGAVSGSTPRTSDTPIEMESKNFVTNSDGAVAHGHRIASQEWQTGATGTRTGITNSPRWTTFLLSINGVQQSNIYVSSTSTVNITTQSSLYKSSSFGSTSILNILAEGHKVKIVSFFDEAVISIIPQSTLYSLLIKYFQSTSGVDITSQGDSFKTISISNSAIVEILTQSELHSDDVNIFIGDDKVIEIYLGYTPLYDINVFIND